MKNLTCLLLLLATGNSSFATTLSGDLVIRNIELISVASNTDAKPQDVLIRDGIIVRIGTELSVSASRTIDGSGQFLSPGLIDGHTHLAGIPGMTYEQEQRFPNVVSAARAQIPRSYLYHGFTTVVDLNSNAQQIERWNTQPVRPTAYFCGAAPIIDGYPMSFIPVPIRYQITPYFLLDGQPAPEGIDAAKHTVSNVVKRLKDDGAVCVKTHYETGFGKSRQLPTPSKSLIRSLVRQAHSYELPVVLHASSQSAYRFGVDVEVDALVHGMWNWDDKVESTLGDDERRLLNRALKKTIALQPTIQVLFGERDLHDPDYLKQSAAKSVLPDRLIDWYLSDAGQSFRTQMLEIPYVNELVSNGRWRELNDRPIQRVQNMLEYWVKNNGKLLFGSDTPSDMTFANPPGLNARLEMTHWQRAGVTPIQFLKAATIDNARFFNLDDDIGSIEEGKRADLLLLEQDPRLSINAFDTIMTVISNGRAFTRDALSTGRE